LLLLTILLIGYAVGKLENWDNFDAIYFAFVTATTLGYGDFRPKRRYSKLLAIALALIGIMFTGMIVAIALHAGNFAFEEVY
jgi:voltage-gated potassium channel Kch